MKTDDKSRGFMAPEGTTSAMIEGNPGAGRQTDRQYVLRECEGNSLPVGWLTKSMCVWRSNETELNFSARRKIQSLRDRCRKIP